MLISSLLSAACDQKKTQAPSSPEPPATTAPARPTTIDSSPEKPVSTTPSSKTIEFNEFIIPLDGPLVVPPSRDAAAMPSGLIAPGDLNGDKRTDLVALISMTNGDLPAVRRIVAISGADHAPLWSIDAPLFWTSPNSKDETPETLLPAGLRALPDINADGIPDVFVFGEGERPGFGALSGKDGAIIGLNSKPKDELIQLVDVRLPKEEVEAMFVFATRLKDDAEDAASQRLGFAIYSSKSFHRSVSFKKPFGRMSQRQTLLFGPFPDTNGDGVNEVLCYGVVPANRLAPSDEPQFALVDGQRIKRWVLTQTNEDPTKGPAFIAAPGVVFPDNFTDLVISSPADVTTEEPSRIGLYVLKQRSYRWELKGNAPLTSEKSDAESPPMSGADIQFGAPVVIVPDLDGDKHLDVATTILNSSRVDSRRLVTMSSEDGHVIAMRDLPDAKLRIEPRYDRVQMTAFQRDADSEAAQIAVSGFLSNGEIDIPVVILFDAADHAVTSGT
ncbi:MAG: hypothetical protein H6818_03000 [Phycisphaerales bacterium]|nr:hypothetical protein [Phycisphaerales bacterium]MCB9864651.1 hypothetical protein [Phycisphaerales bacterium]